jgi:cell division protein FtsW (lipid II flippase)
MIASNLVVRHSFVLTGVIVFVKALAKDFSQRIEIFIVFVVHLLVLSARWRSLWATSIHSIYSLVHLLYQVFDVVDVSVQLD